MIEIKKLPLERWEDYKNLRLRALKNEPRSFGSSYQEEVSLSKEVWLSRMNNALFALKDDKPIGMVVYIFENRLNSKHIAHIYGLYVDEEFRNQGIGLRLMYQAIALIHENKDIRKVELAVNPEQNFAVRLYNRCGFNSIGVYKNEFCVDGQFYDSLAMEKFIWSQAEFDSNNTASLAQRKQTLKDILNKKI
jgi:ribosomal protein S18 acetylase RimI-like enzyme